MFDAEFFRTSLVEQIEEMGGASARCEVHMHAGHAYSIRGIKKAEVGYVWLAVYPPDGMSQKSKAKRTNQFSNEVCFDRVAIQYEHISHVVLTIIEPEEGTSMGFHSK